MSELRWCSVGSALLGPGPVNVREWTTSRVSGRTSQPSLGLNEISYLKPHTSVRLITITIMAAVLATLVNGDHDIHACNSKYPAKVIG
ncbi:hypothetical protein D9619_005299 [Psilocybe cf. subviscida]|uniref:Uncharacterized protein n=1 Tax=Psilocybe cf. subviscida TaxID=2480587 RepID=A0A8H5BW32_9AGAR|nr:hypothetical protein D9619_005299 [Psilocybe cf. subviscida]